MKKNILKKLFGLDGKVIVLAGGAGQIGFSAAVALVEAGAQVAIADLDMEMARDKCRGLASEVRDKIFLHKTDVTSEKSVQNCWRTVRKKLGKIHGVVNCFHYKGNARKLDTKSNFFAPLAEYPLEAWEKVHAVNLRGTFLMCKTAIPYFRENGEGVILNLSSTYGNLSPNKNIYGESGINSPVAYASSKAAIINLTRYMATHLADDKIRANVLSPGGVLNNQSPEFLRNYTQLTPLKRMAVTGDYHAAIIFLLSPGSAYMTGANLVVDGGWTAW